MSPVFLSELVSQELICICSRFSWSPAWSLSGGEALCCASGPGHQSSLQGRLQGPVDQPSFKTTISIPTSSYLNSKLVVHSYYLLHGSALKAILVNLSNILARTSTRGRRLKSNRNVKLVWALCPTPLPKSTKCLFFLFSTCKNNENFKHLSCVQWEC